MVIVAASFTACKKNTENTSSEKPAFRVGLVLDKGGVDDKSFNSAAYRGAMVAKNELGVDVREVETTEDAQVEPALKNFAEKKYDLVIGIGFAQKDALKKAASAYPQVKFAIVDADVQLPNVAALMFQEHQGSFLAGALAAMKSKTNVIGFIGGMDIPLIRRFELGYREGAKRVKKDIKILTNYIGVTGDAWNNPTKAKELALSQIHQKADIIFHAAGASGSGLFDAAEESKGVLAIGVDSNQNGLKPGFVLTSMLKRVDVAVFETIKAVKEGRFQAGRVDFGLKDSGIDLAMDENNKPLVEDWMLKELDKLKKDILSAKISVSDYYTLKH